MTIYYLQMQSVEELSVKPLLPHVVLMEIKRDQPLFNKFLYQLIGQQWQWFDKLSHSEEQWQEYVCRPQLRTWVAYVDGAIAGYFELEQQGSSVEIQYFGLSSDFIGSGIGGGLLSEALRLAWAWDSTERVWVNTCTKDHPHALSNYQARGMSIFKTTDSA